MKRLIVIICMLLSIQVCSASLEYSMDEINSYVKDYNDGKIDAAKLIVYRELGLTLVIRENILLSENAQ